MNFSTTLWSAGISLTIGSYLSKCAATPYAILFSLFLPISTQATPLLHSLCYVLLKLYILSALVGKPLPFGPIFHINCYPGLSFLFVQFHSPENNALHFLHIPHFHFPQKSIYARFHSPTLFVLQGFQLQERKLLQI